MKRCCRICFAFDVKMHKFGDTVYRKFIANVFKQQGYNRIVSKYHYLCYICEALLSKSYNFIERALRAQQVFDELVKQNDEITAMNMLQKIDRTKLNLNYTTLSVNKTHNSSVDEYQDMSTSIKVDIDANINSLNKLNNIIADDGDHGHSDMSNYPYYNIDSVESVKGCYTENNTNENTETKEIEIKLEAPYTVDADYSLDDDITEENDALDFKTDLFLPQPVTQYVESDYVKLESNTVFVVNQYGSKCKKTSNSCKVRRNKTQVVLESSSLQNFNKEIAQEEYKFIDIESDFTESEGDNQIETAIQHRARKEKMLAAHGKDNITNIRRKRKMATTFDSISGEPDLKVKIIKRKIKSKKASDNNYAPDSSEYVDSDCEREFPMTCAHCDSLISSKMEHFHHYLESHRDIKYPYSKAGSLYICEICGAKMNYNKHFKAHLLKHGEKTFECKQCGKMYHTPVQLSAHVTRVHGPKKFVCGYCDKRFADKGSMRLHIRTHTGEKPYKCHICGAGFAHNGNRLLHIRVKHQNRPYPLQEKQETKNQECQNPESQNQDKKTKKTRKQRKRSKNSEDGDTLSTFLQT